MTPDGWTPRRLGEAGKWISGGTPSKLRPDFWSGSIPWVSPKDMKVSRITNAIDHVSEAAIGNGTQLVPPKTLLVVVRGMILVHTFPVALAISNVAFNQDIKALLPSADVEAEYLLYWLQSKSREVLQLVSVANHGTKRLASDELFGLALQLPPLPEQRKIAAILSSLDEAIEATQAVIDQLQVVKQAMMAELLTRGIPGRHKRFKQTEIGEIPEEWSTDSIGSLGADGEQAVRSGPFGSSMKTTDFTSGGVPVLTIQSLGAGEIVPSLLFFTSEAKRSELAEHCVRSNDLVFSRVADIGRCAAISESESGWLISPNLMRIRLDDRRIGARFLMYLLTTHGPTRARVQVLAGNAGRAVINAPTLRTLPIPLPLPEEQTQIARSGESIDRRLLAERRKAAGLAEFKSALMSVLLTGEVRVRPDEDDA